MLHNERYRGVAVWNRTRKIRDPKTGRRVQRERPKSEWTVLQAPQLQIVSQELWEGVQRRLVSVKTAFTSSTSPGLCSRAYSAPYLLSGFLRCGICGSKMVIADGRQSPALLAELEKRERRLNEINEELLASTRNGLEAKLREIEEFAMKRLRDIQGLLGGDVLRENRSWRNTAPTSRLRRKGTATWSAEIGIYWADVRVVPGPRIELATPAFSGRRSTTELPRQSM